MKNLPNFIHQCYGSWLDVAGIISLVAVAAFAFAEYPSDDYRRWIAVGVVALFWLTLIGTFTHWQSVAQEYIRLSLMTLLTLLLFFLGANPFAVVILFFILSSQALSKLPPHIGYGWIIFFGLLTMVLISMIYEDVFIGGLNGLGTLGGYIFMGSAAYAQRQAEEAKIESQQLLDKLQIAHHQLQDHAARDEALAVAEERNRLAREVHDTLGHRLTVAAVQLEGAQRLIPHDPVKAVTMVSTVHTQVLEGLRELRHTVTTLRSPFIEQLSLPNALTRLSTSFEDATGITTELILPDAIPTLPDDYRHTLYRTAQESLTNIQRHAKAKHTIISIDLSQERPRHADIEEDQAHPSVNTVIKLTVADDGIGIPDAAIVDGFGLQGLRERAAQLDGELSILSDPGESTAITLSLPIDRCYNGMAHDADTDTDREIKEE